MPAAVAIPAAVSLGTSIFSGAMGSRAAKKSANIQQEEAVRQAQGFRETLAQYNPQIGTTAEGAATGVLGAAQTGGERVLSAAQTGAEGVRADTLAANEMLSPYTQMGGEAAQSLRGFMAPGGEGMKTFTAADMEQYDPGYKFRLDMAQQAAEKSAAARGGVLGGGFAKALAAQQQGLASSEFGAAAERFRNQQQDRYSRLFGATQLGGQYAGQAGQNLIGAGIYGGNIGMRGAEYAGDIGMRGQEYAGNARMGATGQMAQNAFNTQRSIADMMTGGAAAQAGGVVGSANAWQGALGGIGGAAQQAGGYYQDRSLMRDFMNPALSPTTINSPYSTNMISQIPQMPGPIPEPPPYVRPYPGRRY